jgi:hypothetical protein
MNTRFILGAVTAALFCMGAFAKLPPAPPPDPAAVAAKAEKDKATAEKGKVLQTAAEDRAVKNFQANMKKAGKPVPKPIAIVAAAPPPAPAAKGGAPSKDAKTNIPAKK